MSKNEEFSRLNSVKQCPICGGKVEKGYFTTPRGIYWETEKHKAGTVILDYMMPRISSLFMLDNAPALRCVSCGIAVLDYRVTGETPRSFLKKCIKCGEDIPIASEECPRCGSKQEVTP
jgi:hypothetical protein